MDLDHAKLFFKAGLIERFIFQQAPMDLGWFIMLRQRKGEGFVDETLDTFRGNTRYFKTLEALIQVARSIGYKADSFINYTEFYRIDE